MTKCILCTVDFEVSRYPRFCLACEERGEQSMLIRFTHSSKSIGVRR